MYRIFFIPPLYLQDMGQQSYTKYAFSQNRRNKKDDIPNMWNKVLGNKSMEV